MSSTIYAKGSSRPPVTAGKITVYGNPMSVQLEKIQILLNLFNVQYDTVLISYDSTPEWYSDIQSEGKVPALDTGSEVITRISEVVKFLFSKHPDSDLADARDTKDADVALLLKFHKVDELYREVLLSRKPDSVETYYKEADEAVKSFVSELKKRGTPYLRGNSPGIADFVIWPTIERLRIPSRVFDKEIPPSSGGDEIINIVRKWKDGIIKEKAVEAAKLDVDKFVNILKEEFKK